MERIRSRMWWLLLIGLGGIVALIAGRWLFAEAACPRVQGLLLYSTLALAWIVIGPYAIITRNNSPLNQLITVVMVVATPLLISSILGPLLVKLPGVQAVYCGIPQPCPANQARELRLAGQLEGAEYMARQCLDETSNPECTRACGRELAHILYEEAGSLIEEGRCAEVLVVLDEAGTLADQHGADDVAMAVEERRRNYELACATPTPSPTPTPPHPPAVEVEVLRRSRTEGSASIDFRVLQNGEYLASLLENDFLVMSAAGAEIAIQDFEERSADDPVCIIAVVDNSGSIRPGLNQIRSAIESLNDRRKPSDELGLVLFAEAENVRVMQEPSDAPLNPQVVTGVGEYTALWDGALTGLEQTQNCSVESRYLIILTDGADNDSRQLGGDNPSRAREVARRGQAQNVGICTVGVQSEDLEEQPLELAAYGCRYDHAADFDALVSHFQDIFGYVRQFYRIQFSSPASERTVTLHVLGIEEVSIEFGD